MPKHPTIENQVGGKTRLQIFKEKYPLLPIAVLTDGLAYGIVLGLDLVFSVGMIISVADNACSFESTKALPNVPW